MSALHNVGIIHRDLKLDNVLLKNGVCKISDLGFGSDQKILTTTVGAIGIRAPEYMSNEIRTEVVDVWSFGIVMHMMVF